MQASLQTYQDRLVNITGRNRSLVLRRLYKKRAFDMEQLNAFYPEHRSNFLIYLSAKGRKAFSLLDDPYRDYQGNEKNIKDRLEEQYKENQDCW
jgi:hypothetical protein